MGRHRVGAYQHFLSQPERGQLHLEDILREGALELGRGQSTFQMLGRKGRETRGPECWEGVLTPAVTATFPTKHPKSRADLLLLPWLGTPKKCESTGLLP